MGGPTIIVAGSLAYSLTNFRGGLIRALLARGHRVVASAPDADPGIVGELERWGAEFRRVPMARTGRNPLQDLRTCLSYWRLLRAERPGMVLAYTQKPIIYAGLASRLAGRLYGGTRLVAMVTGLGYVFTGEVRQGWLRRLTVRLYRAALARAAAVLVFNRDDAAELVRSGIVDDIARIRQVPGSGVDCRRFPRVALPDGGPVFLLIARLLGDKGIREYAAAAAKVRRVRPDARVRLLGPFDPNPAAIAAAEVEGWVASGAVDYLGACRDVRPHLAACTVYVLPSYREGLPRTILEAMATGRAIITTDAPGCRETIEEGVSGLLVPPGDADALAEAMLRCCDDPAMVRRMGGEAHERVRARFDVDAVNARLLAILDEVAAVPGVRGRARGRMPVSARSG